jgi:hypothetical protein
MTNSSTIIRARHLRDELDFFSVYLNQLSDSLSQIDKLPANDYNLQMLNSAFSNDEPGYTEQDLLWRNPAYDPQR